MQRLPLDELESDEYEEDEDLQGIAHSNDEANIEFFKSELAGIQKQINKYREKLQYLRKVYLQFAMLINKTVCDHYGPPIVHQKVEKPSPLPTPEIDVKTSNELIHLLTKTESVSSSDVQKFLNNSSVVEKLIFSNQTIFDDQLQNAILMASPDIRMTFFNQILAKLLRCNKFLEGLLPILSKLSLNPILRRQITDPYAKFEEFFEFFEESRKKIGETLGFKDIFILFNTGDSELLYHHKTGYHLLQINNTLIGSFLHSEEPLITNHPLESEKIQRSEERCIFQDDRPCMSMRFSFGELIEDGLVIVFSNQFTESDMTKMQIVIQYTTPALHIFGTVFNSLTPSLISNVLMSISSLYETKDIIKSIETVVKATLKSIKTKVMTLNPSEDFPEVPVLSSVKSLIRAAAEKGGSSTIKLPRFQKGFCKEVDDDTSLGLISAIHVIKIPYKDLFCVSYNVEDANSFKLQRRDMVKHIIEAAPYPIEEYLKRRAIERTYNLDSTQKDLMENFLTKIPKFVDATQDSKLMESIEEEIGIEGVKVEMISLVEENNYFIFPKGTVEEFPEEISNMLSPQHVDFGNGEDVFLVPSTTSTVYTLFYGIKDYSKIDERLLIYLGNTAIVLFPWALMENQLNDLIHRQSYLRGASRTAIDSISDLIDYNLTLVEYDIPISEKEYKSDKKFHILVETKRGIEAAIECDEAIEDDLSLNVLNSFKEYLTYILSSKTKIREVPSEVFNTMIDYVCIFKADNAKLMNFFKTILSIFKTNNIDVNENLKKIKFVKHIFSKISISNWYTDDDKAVIMLLLFLSGIENVWRIKADDYLIDLCTGIQQCAAPIIAAVFNKSFGISDNLTPEKIKQLVSLFNYYKVGPKMEQELEVVARIRMLSDKGWEKSDEGKIWVARSMSMICRAEPWIQQQFNPEQFSSPKKELIYIERVLLPLYSYFSMRNEFMMNDMRTIRTNIRSIRLSPKT